MGGREGGGGSGDWLMVVVSWGWEVVGVSGSRSRSRSRDWDWDWGAKGWEMMVAIEVRRREMRREVEECIVIYSAFCFFLFSFWCLGLVDWISP